MKRSSLESEHWVGSVEAGLGIVFAWGLGPALGVLALIVKDPTLFLGATMLETGGLIARKRGRRVYSRVEKELLQFYEKENARAISSN